MSVDVNQKLFPQPNVEHLKKVVMDNYMTNYKNQTMFVKLWTGNYHQVVDIKTVKQNDRLLYYLTLENYPFNRRIVANKDSKVYVWNEVGQITEDKLPDETVCDYCYYCYQDWLSFWQQDPTDSAASHAIMWRKRFLKYAAIRV